MQDAPSTSQGPNAAPVKTVLIVEDDADIAEVLAIVLQETTAYQVIHVFNGFAALKAVRTLIPHLILLDYLLPGMSGLECLHRLRANKGTEQTPVILMSAALPKVIQMQRGVQACLDVVFLEKPFEMDTLLDLITHLLQES